MDESMPSESRQLVPLQLGALPCEISVPGFDEAYRLHQMNNHESALLVLVKLAGYALLALGAGLLLLGPRSVTVHALYGPTWWQSLLLTPQLPLIAGVLVVGAVGWLQRRVDRQPLPVLEFFERGYLLKLDQPPPAGQAMQIRHLGGARFALALLPLPETPAEPG